MRDVNIGIVDVFMVPKKN